MNGNDYWPEPGENVLELLWDICLLARERGQITVCFNGRRVIVTAQMTPKRVRTALGL